MAQIMVILALLGLCAGSFVNALVFRLHEQSKNQQKAKSKKQKATDKNLSIINGRSMCPNCRHELAWYDLIPLASWLMLRGKCRYCKKPISAQYPLVELIMALVFTLSYLFWPLTVNLNGQWLLLVTWLVCSVGLMALAVYDLKWMLLPNKIIYPTLAVAAAGRAAYIIFFEARVWHAIALWVLSVAVSSGIFFALFTISKGKWIGFGDVRLGLITGTLLAAPGLSLLMIFLASVLGSLVALAEVFRGQKSLNSRIPYGPFLITAAAVCIVFGQPFLDWYGRLSGIS